MLLNAREGGNVSDRAFSNGFKIWQCWALKPSTFYHWSQKAKKASEGKFHQNTCFQFLPIVDLTRDHVIQRHSWCYVSTQLHLLIKWLVDQLEYNDDIALSRFNYIAYILSTYCEIFFTICWFLATKGGRLHPRDHCKEQCRSTTTTNVTVTAP